MSEIYDSIAEEYVQTEQNPNNSYVIRPNFDRFLGNVSGKSVLDLACGNGRYTRRIKNAGASRVVGIDISPEMIRLAREIENRGAQGIEYHVGDALTFCEPDSFDVVTFAFLFNYFPSKDKLVQLCRNIHKNLREDGRMMGVNDEPERNVVGEHLRYGHDRSLVFPAEEGTKFKTTLNWGGHCASFENHFWKRSTYIECLIEAGFKDVRLHELLPVKEGIEKYGLEFWKPYFGNIMMNLLEARK